MIYLKAGISTACLYPQETEKALSTLLEHGFCHFEIFLNTISEIAPAYIKALCGMLREHNAAVKSVHPFTSGYEPYLIFTDYDRRYRDSLDFYDRYFDAAAQLGAELLVIHGDRKTPENGISNAAYFDKFGELSLRGERYGITVAQENVNLFRSQHPSFLKAMRAYLGERAKFVFDVKQAVRSGNDPFAVCSAMGQGLVHVHINDNLPGQDCLLPGKGSMDYNALLDLLIKNGYRGDLMIEVYHKNFRELSELLDAKAFLDMLLSSYGCA